MVSSLEDLESVALRGTAVGSGANTPKGYREGDIRHLSEVSGLNVRPSQNMYYSLQLFKESLSSKKSVRELILSKGLMTKDEIDQALSKENILGLK